MRHCALELFGVIIGSLDHHMAAIGVGVGYHAQVSESTGTVIACTRTGYTSSLHGSMHPGMPPSVPAG